MPPNISEQIYCTTELRFVNCELSTEKKKRQQQQLSNSDRVMTSVNSRRVFIGMLHLYGTRGEY